MKDSLAVLRRITQARRIHELWPVVCDSMAQYGFDRLIYGLTRFRTESGLGDPQDLVMLSSLPRAYMKPYIEEQLYLDAPMVRWALDNDGPCSWSILRRECDFGVPAPRLERVIEFNRAHGVEVGYSVSFQSDSSRMKGGIGLIARPGLSQDLIDDMWSCRGAEVELIVTVAHLKAITLPHDRGRQLTRRQREVLELVGDGKTTNEIAQIVGLTPATIEKHMRLARGTMDVTTTAQAVLKASFQNQIYILPAARS